MTHVRSWRSIHKNSTMYTSTEMCCHRGLEKIGACIYSLPVMLKKTYDI